MIDFSPAARDRELCRRRGGFAYFCRQLWNREVIPRMPKNAAWTWVQQEVCNHYEAMWRGELPGDPVFVLNMSPGGGKSTIVSDLGPAWIWGALDPKALFMGASYDDLLQLRSVENMRSVMKSRWYVERFGDLIGNANTGREFYNTRGGYRFSTSVLGAGTGRHCDLYTVDDPLKAVTARRNEDKDAKEARELAVAIDFMQSSVISRGKDENFRLCVNMQRLHEGDPSGFVQRMLPGSTTLRLPYWFEPHARCVTAIGGDRRTEPDEELDPRLRRKVSLECKMSGGRESALIQAQYQQRPTPPGGRVFHANTFLDFDPAKRDFRPQDTVLTISVDCSFKGGSESDFVGIEIWGYACGRHLCFHSEAERRSFTDTLQYLERLQSVWRAVNILIEDKANGPAVIDVLTQVGRAKLGARVVAVDPKGGKMARARAAAAYFKAGRVYFAMAAPWWSAKRDNMTRFPLGNDDDTDAMTQAVLWHAAEYGGAEELDAAVGPNWTAERDRLVELATPQEVFRVLYGGG